MEEMEDVDAEGFELGNEDGIRIQLLYGDNECIYIERHELLRMLEMLDGKA